MKVDRRLSGRMLGFRSVQVLAYVQAEIAESGKAPSYDMICAELNIKSRGKVSEIVDRLERRGLFKRVGPGSGRGSRRLALPRKKRT